MQIGTTAMENSMEIPQKMKMDITFDPVIAFLGIYQNKTKQTIIRKNL